MDIDEKIKQIRTRNEVILRRQKESEEETVQSSRQDRRAQQSDQNAMYMLTGHERLQYVKWKTEREEIDGERIGRQLGETGGWTREWDRGKGGSGPKPKQSEPSHSSYVATAMNWPRSKHHQLQQTIPPSPNLANPIFPETRVEFVSGRGRAQGRAQVQPLSVGHLLPASNPASFFGKQEIVSGRGRGRKSLSAGANPGIRSQDVEGDHVRDGAENNRPERLVSRSDSFEFEFSSGLSNWADLPTPTSLNNGPPTFQGW